MTSIVRILNRQKPMKSAVRITPLAHNRHFVLKSRERPFRVFTMRSVVFHLFDFPIHSFGACIAVGLLFAHFVISRLARRGGIANPEFASNILVLMILSGFIGARIAYVMEHWSAVYADAPMSVFNLRGGGLMFYGGFITAFAVALVYARGAKIRILVLLDILAPALVLTHAFGRVGCFMNGCCYGRPTDAWYGVNFPPGSIPFVEMHGLPLIPAQLVEAAFNFLIFGILMLVAYKFKVRDGFRAGLYMILYAIVRFIVETLRADTRMMVGPLSISQTISICVFAAGVILMIIPAIRRKE